MKKIFVLGMALLMVVGFATVSTAAISGSDHDLSTYDGTKARICVVCHTPHNADQTIANMPLWNHEVTSATFTPYSSDTLDATVTSTIGGISKLCLSCHDGTVAIDSFGGNTGSTDMAGGALIGNDLSNDHPISFAYNAALVSADGGLETPANADYVDLAKKIPLFSSQLECATCHDVHDDTNGSFLVISNDESLLCLTCHKK